MRLSHQVFQEHQVCESTKSTKPAAMVKTRATKKAAAAAKAGPKASGLDEEEEDFSL